MPSLASATRGKKTSSVVIVDLPEAHVAPTVEACNAPQEDHAGTCMRDLFGEEPPYTEQEEDRSTLLGGTFFYTWMGDFMHKAAREELTLEGLPRPMRAYRAYNVGVRLSEELQRQHERRHAWDGCVGARVGVRWDAASDGVLRWVGVVQQYGTPDQLYAGVEWLVAPAQRDVGVLGRYLLCRSGAAPEHGPGAFHRGDVDGEFLFALSDGVGVATCERVADVFFLPLSRYPAAFPPLPNFSPESANAAPPPMLESVLRAVFTCFRTPLLWMLPLRATVELSAVLGPMALKWYLSYLSPPVKQNEHTPVETHTLAAICSVALMFALHLVNSATTERYLQLATKYGYAARSALCACIAAKCLTISSKALQQPELNVGRVVNLVANDVGILVEAFQGLWMALTIPVMLVVVVYLLYDLMGSSVFIGVGLILLSIPVQAFTTYLSGRYGQQLAKATDARLRVTNEFLSGIRTIKFMGLELQFEASIEEAREAEIRALRTFEYLVVAILFTTAITPTLTVVCMFIAYTQSGHAMTLGVVYPALSLFQLLYSPYRTLSTILVVYAQLQIAMRRLRSVLVADDARKQNAFDAVEAEQNADVAAAAAIFEHATISSYKPVLLPTPGWRRDDGETHFELRAKALLCDVDLRIPRGKLTVVLGPTGSGKSTLLDSLIGALAVTRGRVACSRRVAYVPQQPWIMSATLRDNVVFFGADDAAAFERAVASSQLAADLALLADGAATEIGEKGINLSGGQKARVSLARAVYADRDVYVLDDPLSALDAHVGERVMRECVCGALAHKTRVLATHQVSAAAYADYVVLLEEGRVAFQGTYAAYRQYAQNLQHGLDCDDSVDGCFAGDTADELASAIRLSLLRSRTASRQSFESPSRSGLRSAPSASASVQDLVEVPLNTNAEGSPADTPEEDPAVVETVSSKEAMEEEIATGAVPWSVYRRYIEAAGGMRAFYFVIGVFVASEIVQQAPMVFLSMWAGGTFQHASQYSILRGFILCTVFTVLVLPLRSLVVFNRLRDASLALHRALITALVRATTTFYDVNPLGRITNRVARDMNEIDRQLPMSALTCGVYLCLLVATLTLMTVSQPVMLLALVPSVFLYGRIFRFFCAANREIQRLLNISNSPVFSILHEVLSGRSTINTYHRYCPVIADALTKLDSVYACGYMKAVGSAWLTVRVQLLGNGAVCVLALLGILSMHVEWMPVNVGILALCVSNASTLTSILSGFISVGATIEASMSCVQRVLHYADHAPQEVLETAVVESSAAPITGCKTKVSTLDAGAAAAEPGSLVFEHVDMRYRAGLPLVLRDVSFAIAPGQKVGVVGRTGSGKSTLLLAFLRLVEVCGGRMLVCGRDARDYGVRELRQLFSMIPQDPLLFDGTVRSNVDPFGACGDAAVWAALRQVGMEERVRGDAGGLDGRVQEGGSNFSVGQRQLLCLARALLKRGSAFLLMDEATANVDPALDRQIQLTVQHTFRDYTVVTIAHRLHTVAAYDVVLVMDSGCLVEYGSPLELISRGNSVFSSLVRSLSKGAQQAFFKALNGGEDE